MCAFADPRDPRTGVPCARRGRVQAPLSRQSHNPTNPSDSHELNRTLGGTDWPSPDNSLETAQSPEKLGEWIAARRLGHGCGRIPAAERLPTCVIAHIPGLAGKADGFNPNCDVDLSSPRAGSPDFALFQKERGENSETPRAHGYIPSSVL